MALKILIYRQNLKECGRIISLNNYRISKYYTAAPHCTV
jgi:hypothetical protein